MSKKKYYFLGIATGLATILVATRVDAGGVVYDLGAFPFQFEGATGDRKSTRLNSSHSQQSRMPSSA